MIKIINEALDTDRYFHSLMKSFKSNNKNIKYFNVGDRVREKYANPYRIGTILDIYDNGDVKVEWDYSDGDDIEIIEKHLIELYEDDENCSVDKLWSAVESTHKGSEITPEVLLNTARELYPNNWKNILDKLFDPSEYEWYDFSVANEWYEYIKDTYDYEIPGLPII